MADALDGPPANNARNPASSSCDEIGQSAARTDRRAPAASPRVPPARTCSRGRPPGSRRSRRCGCRSRRRNSRPIWPVMLDRQIGNAAPRIEPVGRRKGRRRADVEAGPAGAAMVGLRRVRRQLERGEDRAEEQPRAEVARDEIGVLALPAEAGRRGERLLHHRRGIDEHLRRSGTAGLWRARPARSFRRALDHVVIVAMSRINGNIAAGGRSQPGQRIA